ncbi:MAG: hypothetical protein BIFFINMI_02140 [Phycisphaerae bacterium]|nr:hypothetical protein [Phycisphaerae bacterium]
MTVKDVANHYLTHQSSKVESGELAFRSFEYCRRVTDDPARFLSPGFSLDTARLNG